MHAGAEEDVQRGFCHPAQQTRACHFHRYFSWYAMRDSVAAVNAVLERHELPHRLFLIGEPNGRERDLTQAYRGLHELPSLRTAFSGDHDHRVDSYRFTVALLPHNGDYNDPMAVMSFTPHRILVGASDEAPWSEERGGGELESMLRGTSILKGVTPVRQHLELELQTLVVPKDRRRQGIGEKAMKTTYCLAYHLSKREPTITYDVGRQRDLWFGAGSPYVGERVVRAVGLEGQVFPPAGSSRADAVQGGGYVVSCAVVEAFLPHDASNFHVTADDGSQRPCSLHRVRYLTGPRSDEVSDQCVLMCFLRSRGRRGTPSWNIRTYTHSHCPAHEPTRARTLAHSWRTCRSRRCEKAST